jgi:hypothetical protein
MKIVSYLYQVYCLENEIVAHVRFNPIGTGDSLPQCTVIVSLPKDTSSMDLIDLEKLALKKAKKFLNACIFVRASEGRE